LEKMTKEVHLADINASFVARVVPDCFESSIGDEALVVAGQHRVVALNSSAAMVFRFLDGEGTVAELADDFSEVLGVERAEVEAQVLDFVRDLGRNGLLVGVAPEVDDEATTDAFEPGDDVAHTALVDLEGAPVSLSDLAGRRLALVNWSPSCGFCSRILPDLVDLAGALAARGVDLVFLTAGDQESNRQQFAEAALDVPVLLRDGSDDDPFGSLGTPSLLLVGPDGVVTEPVVLGANRVPEYLRDLGGDASDRSEAAVHYLPAPAAMCGPGGGATGTSSDWLGTRVYALGDHHVGVRYNTDATAELLDRLFAGARVEDSRAPDNYSVSLADDRDARTRGLDLLVRGSTQLARSQSARRVLRALLGHLSAELAPAPARLTRATATPAVRDGRAVLLPPGLFDHLSLLQPRLTRAGIALADLPFATLDLEARELVVPEPTVAFDNAVLAELDDTRPAREMGEVAPGRYPIDTWYIVRTPDHVGALSPATAVASVLSLLHDVDDLEAAVAQLSELFSSGVAGVGLWYSSLDEMVDQIVDVPDAHDGERSSGTRIT
jgi:thiol-disulfide isomerase/thioredoxin